MNTPYLRASYRVIDVPYEFGRTMMFDAAIRCGTDIVWQEQREPGKLCLTAGAATRRARKVLQAIYDWEVA